MRSLRPFLVPGLPAAALGFSMGAASPGPYLIVVGLLATLVGVGVGVRRSSNAGQRRSLSEQPFLATLRSAKETGPVVNDVPTLELRLELSTPSGPRELVAHERPTSFHLTVPHLTPGAPLPVYADLVAGKARVDWDHWNGARERQEAMTAPPSSVDPALPAPPEAEDGLVFRPVLGRALASSALALACLALAAAGFTLASGVTSIPSPLDRDPQALAAFTLMFFSVGVGIALQVGAGMLNAGTPMIWPRGAARQFPARASALATVAASARRGTFLTLPCVEARLAFTTGSVGREVQALFVVPEDWTGVALTGRQLPVRYDPADPRRVAIDWAAAGAPR